MNHYDGPAFYRKFVHASTINKNQKLESILRKKRHYSRKSKEVTGFSRDVQRADFGNFKPVKTSADHVDLQNNPIARITANFKPRRHYGTPDKPAVGRTQSSNEFEKIHVHYHRLTDELSPNDDDVTLLLSASDDSLDSRLNKPLKDNLNFKLDSETDHLQNESESNYDKIPSRTSTQHFAPLSDEASRVKNTSVSSGASGPKNELGSLNSRSNSGMIDQAPESSKGSSGSEVLDENNQSSSSDRSISSNNLSRNSSEPLGHDFSTIMNDENQDIKKNLTLFNNSNSGNSNSDAKSAEAPSEKSGSNDLSDSSDESLSGSDHPNDISHQNSSDDSTLGLGHHPDFVAENPTNVQSSSDFDQPESDPEAHHSIQPTSVSDYKFPSHQLLIAPKHYNDQGLDDWILKKAEILNKTLKAFHVSAQVVDWTNGPTVTQFQVKLRLGVKVSKINHLADDLKMALAAKDIRIQAPIPGKTTCGIEIPNPKPRPVMLSEVVNSKTFRDSKSDLTIALGVDLTGKPRVTDLRKMPHGLIAGATGSGKSVFINCMLISLMYKATPQELKMILIDPKAVEFAPYNGIPYLLSPVISEPKQAAASLKWATKEMNQRYEKLAAAGVRNIEQFNQKAEKHGQPQMKMPYILIVIDELADLMMVAGDEIETYIVRITQKARAAGIHLVVATQRPSVDVITGTMKNNIPTRVAFMVSSQVDSRTIIDQAGAERLLGKGDMLYLGNGSSHPIRLQGCYVSNREIDHVAEFAKKQESVHYAFHPGSLLKHVNKIENQDSLMPQVLAYIAKEKTVSTSKLQRVFSIGYNRSAKIIDDLEQHNYISGQEGSKPRDVYLTEADYKKLNL